MCMHSKHLCSLSPKYSKQSMYNFLGPEWSCRSDRQGSRRSQYMDRVSFLAPPMQPPRKDAPGTPQARATNGYNHSQSHTPVGSHTPVSNGKSWPVTPYGRVPSPYVAAPEAFAQGWPKTQPVLSLNRRSSCILRPEVLSARREAPTGCSNPPHGPSAGAEPSGFPNLVLAKNDAGIIHVPDVRPSVQPMTDGTLLTVWPGLEDDSRDPPQAQKERGQLTSEEKLDYRELKFVEHLGSGEFGQVFRGFYKDQEAGGSLIFRFFIRIFLLPLNFFATV
eukprot:symbB.v1.2.024402.t1/scaffold2307.1/size82757/7